jgi:arylsulfatase A-like enzyme
MVEYMDYSVGRILKTLDRLALATRTLVLFYSDNGSPPEVTSRMGSRVVPGGKRLTTEAGMHVPLIARFAGTAPAGRICPDLVDSTDFIPTMMEATGARWFDGRPLDGRSLFRQILGTPAQPRDALFSHFDPHPGCKVNVPATRLAWDHRWKLYLDGRLYNTEQDPLEERAISGAAEPPEARAARAKLQGVLDRMAKVKAPQFNRFESDGRPAY